ncbi:MAG: DsbA family oxidoreductase [Acidimicrobiales bacterium]
MIVEIWSDIICPWCYIGKRRFEAATVDMDVEVVWRSFELAPNAPSRREGDYAGHLARKYGMPVEHAERSIANMTEQAAAEGLDYRFDLAQPGNTFAAHRVLHLGRARGVQDTVKERMLRAYFTEGVAIGVPDELVPLAVDAGLDRAEVEEVLATDRYADDVRADEAAARELGISAVPSFVVNRRALIPGAQDPETIRLVLERATA